MPYGLCLIGLCRMAYALWSCHGTRYPPNIQSLSARALRPGYKMVDTVGNEEQTVTQVIAYAFMVYALWRMPSWHMPSWRMPAVWRMPYTYSPCLLAYAVRNEEQTVAQVMAYALWPIPHGLCLRQRGADSHAGAD